MNRMLLVFLASLLFPWSLGAESLSRDSLAGKWLFTHMNLDGMGDRRVNRVIEFHSDGAVINYDAAGGEKSRASYSVDNGYILYVDDSGAQRWQVEKFEADALEVDHSGAKMFFKRN